MLVGNLTPSSVTRGATVTRGSRGARNHRSQHAQLATTRPENCAARLKQRQRESSYRHMAAQTAQVTRTGQGRSVFGVRAL